jgi:hypothetical protein
MFRDKRNFTCRGTEITQQMEISLQKSVRPQKASVALYRLMERYQQADPAPAHALVVTLSADLLRCFRSQVASRQQADDPLQETWMRIHRVRHTDRPGEQVRPWVYAIARWVRVDGYPVGSVSRRTRSQWRCCRSGFNIEMHFPQEPIGALNISINAGCLRTRPCIRSYDALSPTSSRLPSI